MIQSMFDVLPQDVTVEGNDHGYIFIKKNCSCLSTTKVYASNTTYTMKSSEGYAYDIVIDAYDGLGFLPNTTRLAKVGAVISLRLFCGCSNGLWNYLMSYVMGEGDTVESLSSRFGVSMDSIEAVNGIGNPDNITVGALYYIPLNSGSSCAAIFSFSSLLGFLMSNFTLFLGKLFYHGNVNICLRLQIAFAVIFGRGVIPCILCC